MRATALAALADADVILYLADATEGDPEPLADLAGLDRPPRAPIVRALNKVDLLSDARRAELAVRAPDAAFVSASTGEGIEPLTAKVASLLPESPFLYPEDELSTQTLRFFAAELVRETAFEQLDEELPYGVACVIEEFRESQTPVYIRAVLHVERESQKRILIGSEGRRIRDIGRDARRKIETLVGSPVYLDLWVKVLPNWRRNPSALARLGYTIPEDGSP
jgi:GTP-binding protein Era